MLWARLRCCPGLFDAFGKRTGLGSKIRAQATDGDFVRSRLSRLVLYALIATSFPSVVVIRLGRPAWNWFWSSRLSLKQPSAVVVPPEPEAVSALPQAEGCLADIVPGKSKWSVTDGAMLGCAVPAMADDITHACLLWYLRGRGLQWQRSPHARGREVVDCKRSRLSISWRQ
jgi:hypothetical protein